jgi:hypothetical protein
MDTYTDAELRELLTHLLTLIHGELTEEHRERIERAIHIRTTVQTERRDSDGGSCM